MSKISTKASELLICLVLTWFLIVKHLLMYLFTSFSRTLIEIQLYILQTYHFYSIYTQCMHLYHKIMYYCCY